MAKYSVENSRGGFESDFIVNSDCPELFEALPQEFLGRKLLKFAKGFLQLGLDDLRGQLVIAMCPAGWFRKYLIYDFELHQVGGREAKRFGGIRRLGIVAPKNSRATFR